MGGYHDNKVAQGHAVEQGGLGVDPGDKRIGSAVPTRVGACRGEALSARLRHAPINRQSLNPAVVVRRTTFQGQPERVRGLAPEGSPVWGERGAFPRGGPGEILSPFQRAHDGRET